ncbi:hypothetical protein SSE37_04235 [Sagittula stellata E-37]|uniref:Uncharacterized protein n=1 Tax=Sagittula stellata (strain ATCC 700073 / DSM 11524 / E-37) TaxID=388399 RepID=A3K1M7_SAGS3|nr:hypothetical protein SSE37_04235 [Sagittula stellata E-37]
MPIFPVLDARKIAGRDPDTFAALRRGAPETGLPVYTGNLWPDRPEGGEVIGAY